MQEEQTITKKELLRKEFCEIILKLEQKKILGNNEKDLSDFPRKMLTELDEVEEEI